jgi:hypothetical protein
LAKAAGGLTELDLTGNLVHDWAFLSELVSALPNLRVSG